MADAAAARATRGEPPHTKPSRPKATRARRPEAEDLRRASDAHEDRRHDRTRGAVEAALVDKLHERLALTQTTAALYQALAVRFPAARAARLEALRDEALRYHAVACDALRQRGEPWFVTSAPSALASLACSGVVAVVREPSTSFAQCVQAMLVIELTNEEGFASLADLALATGDARLSAIARIARFETRGHADTLRSLSQPRPSGPSASAKAI